MMIYEYRDLNLYRHLTRSTQLAFLRQPCLRVDIELEDRAVAVREYGLAMRQAY
jgi:ABC-type thiamine transport system ATPase subunit